jgi:hypothetical protein
MKSDLPNFANETNDPLDAFLLEANEHVPDAGFTARVIGSLPNRQSRWSPRFVIIAVAMLLCAGLALWQLPPITFLLTAWGSWLSDSATVLMLGAILLAAGTLICGAYALAREEGV